MGDDAGHGVGHGVPHMVGRLRPLMAGADEVVDQDLVRAGVAVGEPGELPRQALDRMDGSGARWVPSREVTAAISPPPACAGAVRQVSRSDTSNQSSAASSLVRNRCEPTASSNEPSVPKTLMRTAPGWPMLHVATSSYQRMLMFLTRVKLSSSSNDSSLPMPLCFQPP